MRINQLSKEASDWLKDHGYTESTNYIRYVRVWNGLVKSTDKNTDFLEDISASYVTNKYGRNIMVENPSLLPPKEYRIYRAFKALEEFHSIGSISGTSMTGASVRQALPEYENSVLESYMLHIGNLGYSIKSKRYAYGTVHHYLLCCPLSIISDSQVLGYFNTMAGCSKQTIKSKLKVLKRFLVYCFEQRFLDVDYSVLFPSAKKRRYTEIPSVYTPDEISLLLDYLRNNNQNRKRNYAIALLTAVYGFRSGDLVDMLLSDIDWNNGIISIVQSKTGNSLEPHLLPQTGNAIADYLLEERPDSTDPHIFLKQAGNGLSSTSVSSMIFNAFLRSGIVVNGRKHGCHSLRHSLASNMLASDSSMLIISKTLGHASVDTTRIYAKVDIIHLRLCGLEVPTNEK
jgi:integrase